MSTTYPNIALTPDLQSLLAGLRWRIRLYIWAEGIALAVIWLGLMFWFGFALDYLPVLMGASEMPLAPRAVLLAATGLALAYILYRWIGRRVFVPLGDRSLALLLERRFSDFHDSLVTAVEMADAPNHATAFNRELLARTTDEAREGAGHVRYGEVFNKGSLTAKIIAAVDHLWLTRHLHGHQHAAPSTRPCSGSTSSATNPGRAVRRSKSWASKSSATTLPARKALVRRNSNSRTASSRSPAARTSRSRSAPPASRGKNRPRAMHHLLPHGNQRRGRSRANAVASR